MPATPADQAIIDEPFRVHARDGLWRPRFTGTGLHMSLPLARARNWARLLHEHQTPLTDHPHYKAREVLRAAAGQPQAAGPGGGPRHYCGPWRDGKWRGVAAHNVFFLHTRCGGNRARTINRFDFHTGKWPAPHCASIRSAHGPWGGAGAANREVPPEARLDADE